MHKQTRRPHTITGSKRTLAAAALLAFAPALALAQTPRGSAGSAADACAGSHQDRQTCLREAAAARAEMNRGRLGAQGGGSYEQNALRRCDPLPASEREACYARVRGGSDTTIRGSVEGGGVIREHRQIVPMAPATTAPAPATVQPLTPQAPLAPAIPMTPASPVQPGYAPAPAQPGYAPVPQSQPGYAPVPQTQPGYAPVPPQSQQPGYAPVPQTYDRPLGTGAAPGLRPSGIAPIPPAPSGSSTR